MSDREGAAVAPPRPKKLAPLVMTLQNVLEEHPFHYPTVVQHPLKSLGYDAGTSIVTDEVRQLRYGL